MATKKAPFPCVSILLLYCASGFGAPQHIIDAHIHLFDPGKPGGIEWPSPGDPIYKPTLPADYKKIADPLKITGAVVVECSFKVEENQWQLDLIKNEPALYGFIGNLEFGSSNFDNNLTKFSGDKKFLGLRGTLDVNNQGEVEDAKALARKKLVLELWYGSDLFALAKAIAAKVPELPIIVDHAGNTTANGKPLSDATLNLINSMAPFTNIYCKVSSLFKLSGKNPAPIDVAHYTPLLDALYAAFGPDRLIFASDWPTLELNGRTLADELAIVTAYFSAKSDSVLQKVLWKNAVAFYHLPGFTPSNPATAPLPPNGANRVVCGRSGISIRINSGGNETIDCSLYRLDGTRLFSMKKKFGRAGAYLVSLNGHREGSATLAPGAYLCRIVSRVRDDVLFAILK